jgi:hypothetical protein
MNENLNLADILKDVPKGTKLWSSICGDCYFQYIDNFSDFPITCLAVDKYGRNKRVSFTKYGQFYSGSEFANGECVLFPSNDNRDWSTFKVPKAHKEFEPYQKVLVKVYGKSDWDAGLYNHYDVLTNRHYLVGGDWVKDEFIIPYEENKDKLGKPVE